jgi:YbgC/YbaW family acyl-CoA thioester hydrolase
VSASGPVAVSHVRVRYAETDQMGVAYYANYLVWFEVGRTEFLRSMGWSYRDMEAAGYVLPVIAASCAYHRPARYDDELEIRTRGALVSPIRLVFDYEILRGGRAHRDRAHRARVAEPRGQAGAAAAPRQGPLRMHALVTGAAGFIGSTLVERLLGQGARVTGIDCFTDYYPRPVKERNLQGPRASDRFTFVEAALQETDLGPLLEGVTHVFHLAAQAGVRRSWGREFQVYTVNNIEATQVLLEACVGRPIERLVYASSSSVYGDNTPVPMREDTLPQPVSPYGVSKLAAEQLCYLYSVNHGVPATSVRYFTVYGPRQRPDMGFHRFLSAALRDEAITVYGDGEQTRDFTFVADAVSATIAAANAGCPAAPTTSAGDRASASTRCSTSSGA